MIRFADFEDPARLVLMAGPCVIESEEHVNRMADAIAAMAREAGFPYVFKASFDKANRTSAKSFRGPGIDEGLRILAKVRSELDVPVLTDVHTEAQVEAAAQVVDILQIPAFLCRQTDLIEAAVATGKIVNIKNKLVSLVSSIEQVYEEIKGAETQKDFALLAIKHRFSGVLFALRAGKVESAIDWFKNASPKSTLEWLNLEEDDNVEA